MNKSLVALALAAALGASASVNAADFKLLNQDPAGVGLNDTTPAVPVGGNPGTTRGEQARIVYQFAMDMWGGVLESSETVNVYASFAPLTCTASSGTLAQAGANWTFILNDNRRYGSALADALVGFDIVNYFGLDDDPGDIFSQFNGDLGKPGCLTGLSWYFGVDGNTPAGQVNFLNVVMHELGHGLGAQGFLSKTTGALNGGYSDPYTYNAYDNVLNLGFEQMSSAQRALAMRTPGRTVWSGARVNSDANLILDGDFHETVLQVSAPAPAAGTYGFYTSNGNFGPAPTAANFNGEWVIATDIAEPALPGPPAVPAGTTTDGCSVITNPAAIAGKIAMIDRGGCGFVVKVKNAQNAGATGVVILNTSGSAWGALGGADPTITIPAVIVQFADVAKLKANAPITGGMVDLPATKAGLDSAGRTRLYSPFVVAGGSTFSHFDTVLAPDALMEPFDSPTVQANANVDLTPALFADIGWELNPGNGQMGSPNVLDCDTGTIAYEEGGLVPGAAVEAIHGVCLSSAQTRLQYHSCMNTQKTRLVNSGLLTTLQGQKVMLCAKKVHDRTRFPVQEGK